MSYSSNFNLNQRISYLESIIQQIVPSLPLDLDKILSNGNSAGTYDIDLNNNDILNVNNIDLLTINGSAYPPQSTPSSSVFNYKAHTNSQAPPITNGQIEWNNAVQASATQIYLSHLDDDGDDIQVLLSALPLGTIFLIQDQAIGSNYQRWTITSVASVINQYITFGVSLLASTHSFSNNDPVLLIVQSANQNLSQVLAVGNSAGAYDIDLNGNDILNAPLIQSQTNQNITIEGLGTGDVILKTAGANQVVVNDTGLTTLNTRELINYTGVGGTANPTFATIKNNATAGVIYETKTITGRNVLQNEELYRMSVIGQTATAPSQEFARIEVSSTNVGGGNNDGSIDFWASVNGTTQEVFRMNGADNENNSFRPLDLNGNALNTSSGNLAISAVNSSGTGSILLQPKVGFGEVGISGGNLNLNSNSIFNANSIFTSLGNRYAKQITPVFLNANTNVSSNIEDLARYNAWNAGRTATWDTAPLGSLPFPSITGYEVITASQYGFNGNWWIGTDVGNVWYSTDNGNSWTFLYAFGARIRCFQSYNNNTYLAIGGDFTTPYNYLVGIDTSLALFDITAGSLGLNGAVYCFFENTTFACLYIGGAFNALFGSSGVSYGFYTYDWNTNNLFAFNLTTGDGFKGGIVRTIAYNIVNSSNVVSVGGDFTLVDVNSSSQFFPYIFSFETNLGYNIIPGLYGSAFNPNGNVYSILPYGGTFIVGGTFTNSLGQGSCNTQYGFQIDTWTGTGFTGIYDYPLYNPTQSITSIVFIPQSGNYYTIENLTSIRVNAIAMPSLPAGSQWECISYSGSQAIFNTNSQPSFLGYIYNNSLVISISSVGVSFITYSGVYNTINLLGFGSNVEMMYNSGSWWVIAYNGATFS